MKQKKNNSFFSGRTTKVWAPPPSLRGPTTKKTLIIVSVFPKLLINSLNISNAHILNMYKISYFCSKNLFPEYWSRLSRLEPSSRE